MGPGAIGPGAYGAGALGAGAPAVANGYSGMIYVFSVLSKLSHIFALITKMIIFTSE